MGHFPRVSTKPLAFSRSACLTALVLLAACTTNVVESATPETYRITDGACGDVVFVENLATDLATAIEVIEARKVGEFGPGEVTLETYQLQVVDQHGVPPEAEFHAVRVEDTDTGQLVHSVGEVVTTDGDLFRLEWCPD